MELASKHLWCTGRRQCNRSTDGISPTHNPSFSVSDGAAVKHQKLCCSSSMPRADIDQWGGFQIAGVFETLQCANHAASQLPICCYATSHSSLTTSSSHTAPKQLKRELQLKPPTKAAHYHHETTRTHIRTSTSCDRARCCRG